MKALFITSTPTHPLLRDTLFEILSFDEKNEVIWAYPENQLQLKWSKPDVIVPIGEQALNRLKLTGITKLAGTEQEFEGYPVIPSLDPGIVEQAPHLMKKFAMDLYKAYEIGMGLGKMSIENQVVEVTSALQLMDLISYIQKSGYCSLDFETVSLKTLKTYDPDFYITTMSISFQQGGSYVIPLYHKDSPNPKEFIKMAVEQLDKDVFQNPDVTLIAQNVKFELHCLSWLGIKRIRGPIHDTMTMHHILDEHSSHRLKDIIREYNPRFANYEKDLGKVKEYADIPLPKLIKYNALDSDLTLRLYWQLTELLLEDERLYILYRNLVAASTAPLFAMEQEGMLIDKEYLIQSMEEVQKMIDDIGDEMFNNQAVSDYMGYRLDRDVEEYMNGVDEKIIKLKSKTFKTEKAIQNNDDAILNLEQILEEYDGKDIIVPDAFLDKRTEDINLASPVQMKELLFGPAGFKFPIPNDQWGNPMESTGKEVLDLIKDKSGFIDNLLAYRQLNLIYKTYLQGILDRMDSTHRIHGTFNQHGTKTGRLSASDPNLQNIIKRTKYKKVEEAVAMVMKCFIPPKGLKIMQADFSQVELRLIAYYAQETNMLEAYAAGEDLHALTAATVKGITLEQFKVLPDKERKRLRFEAKAVNFGFIYGISPEGFRDYARITYGLEISLKKAKDIRLAFFKKYPKLLDYHKTYIAKAKKFGYVRTMFGRKVRLPDIYSNISAKQGHAERNAINSPNQGTAGEMMIFALALLWQRAPWLLFVNTVHDSALPYLTDRLVQSAMDIIRETMENLPTLEYFDREADSVTMKVDFEISDKSWGELQEVI